MKNFFFLLFCSLILLPQLYAQNSGTLADMQFIAGHWETTKDGRVIEAFWTEPEGDNMVGVIRMMNEDKATLYEMFAIEMTESGLEVKVKHFKPGLVGLEEKDKFDHYKFVESSDGRAVFAKQGEEVRVLYEKRPGKKFAIAIGKPVNGDWKFEDFWVFGKKK
ncbi:DUF6265 family protein [Catalinimonas niigatensis]|uniref:DUF6265 family protein n=1 Tax=Catalinimonas niigatensis TaxID=1397264 RepID=UPI002665E5E2|nr:DUF6265 family protein [Catalinimonas niigatensis]WPP50726.1 DUF6265 family protein [Catalinimonas niigatensis]